MKKLNEYFKLEKEIYKYFGYQEEWSAYPLDDCTMYYWFLTEGEVWFFDSKEAYDTEDGMHMYSNELFGAEKQIYSQKDYTMIKVNTRTDGNKFLAIYDNSKMLPIKKINF